MPEVELLSVDALLKEHWPKETFHIYETVRLSKEAVRDLLVIAMDNARAYGKQEQRKVDVGICERRAKKHFSASQKAKSDGLRKWYYSHHSTLSDAAEAIRKGESQ